MNALASPQKIHAAIENSFPPDMPQNGRNLWRTDKLNDALYLLVLSSRKPDFTHIVEQFGWPGSDQGWETKDYNAFLKRISSGQKWQFRLRANPVRSVKLPDKGDSETRSRGKIYAHVTVKQQEQWLLERSDKNGFKLLSYNVIQQEIRKFQRQNKPVTIGTAVFEGVLEIVDTDLFIKALTGGIGRAKAYGCGLLTITQVMS